ncbi:hypothetical protein B0H19DRAFT_1069818 [Mycena capillaripes]|nr:hypothetical protein B0H19DRAFT_1069818 [Mycena capillaripes]
MGTTSAIFKFEGSPQRCFDPIHNQWDLCRLFVNNDPVFGEGFAEDPDSDDDDMDVQAPTFPQNIDMASHLPPEGTNMQVVQEQERHDFGLKMPFDAPAEEDLGPDVTESDLPTRDIAKASRKTEEPEYEPVAGNLLDMLQKRFGFLLPPDADKFIARDPPKEPLDPGLLANIVGMADIGNQLAAQKGLENALCTFFGQCLEARSFNDIEKALLDCHQPPSPQTSALPLSPFQISREYLTSMRNPAEHAYYYMLCRIGSGIGSEVLLTLRATDLLEVLRQSWGPDIKDVAARFLAGGIPFWLAYVSTEIMPASAPVLSGFRPKSFKANTRLGLGSRPYEYVFDEHDYKVYVTQRNLRLLHTPRGRVALQYSRVIARLARSEVADDDFFRGFDDDIYNIGDCLWDQTSPHAYWYDKLFDHEIDLICSVYHIGTGQKQKGKGKQAGKAQPATL